jgi:hypothetical protein
MAAANRAGGSRHPDLVAGSGLVLMVVLGGYSDVTFTGTASFNDLDTAMTAQPPQENDGVEGAAPA